MYSLPDFVGTTVLGDILCFCHATSLEFTLGLFCQTPSGFPVHLAKGYLAPHHVMAAFHGEDVVLPLPMVATIYYGNLSNMGCLQYPISNDFFPLSDIQCLGHVPLNHGFFPKQVNGRGRVLHPHRSVSIVINSKGLWGGLTAGESGSSVPRFHIYGMLFFHIRPIAYCINNIYIYIIYKYTYVII